MSYRKGEVPAPKPGAILKRQRQSGSDRLKRLDHANAPVNTLDRRSSNKTSSTQTLYVEIRGAPVKSQTTPKRLPSARPIIEDSRPAKRPRTDLEVPNDTPGHTPKVPIEIESIAASSTMSMTGRSPGNRDSKLQLRQEEYRNVSSLNTSRSRRRRSRPHRAWKAANPEAIEGSDRSSIISASPKPPSPDELRNYSPSVVKSDIPPLRTPLHGVLRFPITAIKPDVPRTPLAGPKNQKNATPSDDISEDELAIGGVGEKARSSKPKPPNPATKDARTQVGQGSGFALRRAASGTHVYEPAQGFSLAPQPGNHVTLQAIAPAGESLHLPWLRIHLGRINAVTYGGDGCRIILINRPQSNSVNDTPSKLVLEFQEEGQSKKFTHMLRQSTVNVTMKFLQRTNEWMNSAAQRLFDEARKGPPPELEDLDSTREVQVDINDDNEGGSRMTQKPAPGPDTPDAKQKTTPKPHLPSETVFDLPPRRSTRKATVTPQWSEENKDWEKSWDRSLVYPRTGRDRATVEKEDIRRLDEGEFLNDNLILCYLRYLQASAEVDISSRVYFMNTYFFSSLKKGKGLSINYDGVKNWTSKVDLFSYDYIVVPVHESLHWYLLIVCNPSKLLPSDTGSEKEPVPIDADESSRENTKESFHPMKVDDDVPNGRPDDEEVGGKNSNPSTPSKGRPKSQRKYGPPVRKYDPQDFRVISLDSLGSAHSPACQMLRDYLLQEIRSRKKVKPSRPASTGMTAKDIPTQSNMCDCGVFLLGYVKHFLADPDGFVTTLLQKEKPTWKIDAPSFRAEIREKIFDLHRQQALDVAADDAQKKKKKKKGKKGQDSGHETTPSPSDPIKSPGPERGMTAEPIASKQNSPVLESVASLAVQPTLDPVCGPPPAETIEEDVACKYDRPFTKRKVPSSPLATCEDDALGTPSTSGETTSTFDQDIGRAYFAQEDQPHLSPWTRSPHEAWTFKKLAPEPEAAIRPSIEAQDGVIGDEPIFIDTIPSSSPSQRAKTSPSAPVELPKKRPVGVIDIDSDEQQPSMQRQRRRETSTRSQYFTSNDGDRDPIYVPRETKSAGTVRLTIEDDRSPRSKRRRVKTIDLSD